jgi:DNA ligase (NAD+)
MNLNEVGIRRRIFEAIKANDAYRSGSPIISDEKFDSLMESIAADLPADEYGDLRKQMTELKGEVKHLNVIGSLNKFKYGEGELLKWLKKNKMKTVFISEKIDGCSFVAEYDNGNLINGATRGDGYDGQDITEKLRLILPQNIKNKKYMYIRGEITLTGDDYFLTTKKPIPIN